MSIRQDTHSLTSEPTLNIFHCPAVENLIIFPRDVPEMRSRDYIR